VRALVEFSWASDDDATLLHASDLFQYQNVASTFFGELLDARLALEPRQDPLTTKVTISGQQSTLSSTGENMEFRLFSVVDLTYIGEEEIPTLAFTLAEITKGQEIPAYLTNNTLSSTFTMSFSDPPLEVSTILYTVKTASIALEEITTDQEIPVYLTSSSLPSTFTTSLSDPPLESSSTTYTVQNTDTSQTGLVDASFILVTAAAAAFIAALLILLWAVGCFKKWKSCKNLRSRFYVDSSTPKSEHEMIAKSTSDSTQDGTVGTVVHDARTVLEHVEEAIAPDETGFEVSNTKAVVRKDEMEACSSVASEVSTTLPIITCTADLKCTSDQTNDGNGNVEALLESYLDDEFDEENLCSGQSVTDMAPTPRSFGSKRKKKLMTMLSPSRKMADSFSVPPFGSAETEALSPTGQSTVMSDFSEFSKGRLSVVSSASHTNNNVYQSKSIKSTESILADLLVCHCEEGPATDVDESTAYTDGTGTIFSRP
jgi:hypothetical protein